MRGLPRATPLACAQVLLPDGGLFPQDFYPTAPSRSFTLGTGDRPSASSLASPPGNRPVPPRSRRGLCQCSQGSALHRRIKRYGSAAYRASDPVPVATDLRSSTTSGPVPQPSPLDHRAGLVPVGPL